MLRSFALETYPQTELDWFHSKDRKIVRTSTTSNPLLQSVVVEQGTFINTVPFFKHTVTSLTLDTCTNTDGYHAADYPDAFRLMPLLQFVSLSHWKDTGPRDFGLCSVAMPQVTLRFFKKLSM